MKKLLICSILSALLTNYSYCMQQELSPQQINESYKKGHEYFQEKKYVEAFKCIEIAALHGHADANAMLGAMYFNGQGCKKDHNEAFKYTKAGKEYGSAVATRNLGLFYHYGYGDTLKDDYIAIGHYRTALEMGIKLALIDIGDIYYDGLYTDGERDIPEYELAFYCYNTAAQLNLPKGLQKLGQMYYSCIQDYEQAKECYEKALAMKYNYVLRDLGDLYYCEEYEESNPKKAFDYYKKASLLGDPISTKYIADAYYHGEWPYAKDPNMSLQYYNLAIDLFNQERAEGKTINASREAGLIFYYGINGRPNYKEAIKYFQITIDEGEDDGRCAYYAGCCCIYMKSPEAQHYLQLALNGINKEYAEFAREILVEDLGMECYRR